MNAIIAARGLAHQWREWNGQPLSDAYIDKVWKTWATEARQAIAALEAAGFRIVGPEPSEKMKAAAKDDAVFGSLPFARSAMLGIARRVWQKMHAAAPKWGDGQ